MQTTLELLDDTYTIFTKNNNDSLDNTFMMNLENLINGNKGKVQGNLFRGIDNKTKQKIGIFNLFTYVLFSVAHSLYDKKMV